MCFSQLVYLDNRQYRRKLYYSSEKTATNFDLKIACNLLLTHSHDRCASLVLSCCCWYKIIEIVYCCTVDIYIWSCQKNLQIMRSTYLAMVCCYDASLRSMLSLPFTMWKIFLQAASATVVMRQRKSILEPLMCMGLEYIGWPRSARRIRQLLPLREDQASCTWSR